MANMKADPGSRPKVRGRENKVETTVLDAEPLPNYPFEIVTDKRKPSSSKFQLTIEALSGLLDRIAELSKISKRPQAEILAAVLEGNQTAKTGVPISGTQDTDPVSPETSAMPISELPPHRQTEEEMKLVFKRSLANYPDAELVALRFGDDEAGYAARYQINRHPLLVDMPRDVDGPQMMIVPKDAIATIDQLLSKCGIKYSTQLMFDTNSLSPLDLSYLRAMARQSVIDVDESA